MNKNLSYRPLIINWENYIISTNEPDLRGFARYLLLRDSANLTSLEKETPIEENVKKQDVTENGPYLTPEVAELIFRLNKFIRIYGKPILKECSVNSMDEFVILAHLLENKKTSKKDLIHQNLIEFTTGIDMLGRMIKSGLLNEKVNLTDKRQKIISISKKGKDCLFQIFEKFQTMTDVLGDLEKEEREKLFNTLKRLNQFHTALLEKK